MPVPTRYEIDSELECINPFPITNPPDPIMVEIGAICRIVNIGEDWVLVGWDNPGHFQVGFRVELYQMDKHFKILSTPGHDEELPLYLAQIKESKLIRNADLTACVQQVLDAIGQEWKIVIRPGVSKREVALFDIPRWTSANVILYQIATAFGARFHANHKTREITFTPYNFDVQLNNIIDGWMKRWGDTEDK